MMSTGDAAKVRAMLGDGDRRSIGRADAVAMGLLEGTIEAGAVFEAMFDEEPLVRMRAADALEKASARRPELLHPYQAELLTRLPDVRQMEVRWHMAQMLPRLALSARERRAIAVPVLLGYLRDKSRIVQTFALQALADFAAADARLRPQVIRLVEEASRTGSPAVKARSRHLLARLKTPDRSPATSSPTP